MGFRGCVLPTLLSLILLEASSVAAADDPHWTYEGEMGPEHWADHNSACAGSSQSPVNIIVTDADPDSAKAFPLSVHYPPQTRIHSVTNNGHSIQYDFDQGDEIEFNGDRYALKQIHFHEPSEHTLNGVRYPIEMHLVHANEARGEYTVIGLLGYEGAPNKTFAKIEQFVPHQTGETLAINQSIDLNGLFDETLTPRFHYRGSLTTPPCSENVNWVVFEEPFMLSHDQVVKLKELMPKNNYRDVQPLNTRHVTWVVN